MENFIFVQWFDKDLSAKDLKYVLNRMNNNASQSKMSFNPGPNKQAQEVFFPQNTYS